MDDAVGRDSRADSGWKVVVSPKSLYEALKAGGVGFFTGVPDSLLKEFCAFVEVACNPAEHVIAANEGSAVGLAAGFHLATGRLPLVYMQNSGLGNAVNPLLSLADQEVYSIPMVILVGWRGAPGFEDEPQHLKQGRVTPGLLSAIEIPWQILGATEDEALDAALWATQTSRTINGPVILLVEKGTFSKAGSESIPSVIEGAVMPRERSIEVITSQLNSSHTIVSTTGMISRELYEGRKNANHDRSTDFLTVGSMGHACQIAFGIAMAVPDNEVVCLDGDGAVLMHMGGLATIGASSGANLFHIVLNNGVHDSVGGQPTVAQKVSLSGVAKACGYDIVGPVARDELSLREAVADLRNRKGTRFLEVIVTPGARSDLGRPVETPNENKQIFMRRLMAIMGEG